MSMTADELAAKYPEAIVFVPTGGMEFVRPGQQFINGSGEVGIWIMESPSVNRHRILRRTTLAELVAEAQPKLPAVGSVWRLNDGSVIAVYSGIQDGTVICKQTGCELPGTYNASAFAEMESNYKMVLIHDPSKESADAR